MASRILALILSFLLGFLSCIGAIFGVGYYAYSQISLDKLEKWGVQVNDERYIDPEEGEVDLTAMTIKSFLAEIDELRNLTGQTVSIDYLIRRWGLTIDEEYLKWIPSGVRTLAVAEIFSSSGLSTILENTDVSYLFQFLPADVLAEPAREALTGKTLKEVVDLKMTDLLSGMKLGYLVGVKYEKDGGGRYVPVYGDPANPTLLELIGSLDLGRTLDVIGNGGDMLAVINDGMNDVLIDLLIKSVSSGDNATLTRLLAGKTIGDVIVEDEETGALSFDLGVVINGKKAGDLLGYTPVYLDGDAERGIIVDWLDGDGAPVKGAMRAFADGSVSGLGGDFDINDLLVNSYLGFFQEFDPVYDSEGNIIGWLDGDGNPPDRLNRTLANKKLTTLLDDGFSVDKLVSGLYVGDLMSYTPVEDGEGNIIGWKDSDGNDLDRVTEALAKQSVDKLTSGDFEIDDALEGLYVGDLLKYTPIKDDPDDPEKITGWKAEDGSDLDRVSESLAKMKMTDLTSGDFEVGDALEGLYVGDLLEYTPIKDDPDDPEKITGWLDKDNKEVTGIDRATANIDLYRLVEDDTYKVTDAFNEVYMGEAMGYYHGADPLPKADPSDPTHYQWYKDKDAVTGDLSNPTTGIEQKLSNYFLGDLIEGRVTADDLTNGMPLYDLLNLHATDTLLYDADGNALCYTTGEHIGEQATVKIWYDKNDVRQSDTISALAYCTIDGISSQVNAVKVGGVTGLTLFEENWYKAEFRTEDFDGDAGTPDETRLCLSPASGVLPSLADLTIGDLSNNDLVTDKIKTVRIGDAMGYTQVGGVWYSAYDPLNPETGKVTGMMKALASKTVGNMETIGDDMPIGELLGYTKVGTVWYETYIDVGDPGNVKASGIMASIADFYINGLGDNVKTIRIGSILELYRWESDDPLDPNYGTWYKDEDRTIPADGIMAKFAELTVEDMKDSEKVTAKTKTILIADAMGYELHDGIWYSTYVAPDDPSNVKVSGMMKALAPKTIGEMNTVSSTVPVGELLGYERHGEPPVWYSSYIDADHYTLVEPGILLAISDFTIDGLESGIGGVYIGEVMGYKKVGGVWYSEYVDEEHKTPAAGIMKPFAGLTIDQMKDQNAVTNAVKSVKVGEAMGYKNVGGVWYSTYVGPDDPGNVKASGVIQAVADSTIESLETDLNDTEVGKILGYTYDEGEHWWYDGSTRTSTIINTVSGTQLKNLGARLSNLTVADMFSDAERASGFLSLLPPNALLSELGGSGSNSMSYVFQNTTMGDYVNKGLISFSASTQAKLTLIDPSWQSRTIQQFIDHLINSVPTTP